MKHLDVFVGGMLETTPSGPGELFRIIILDQFYRIRDGDRFWFENKDNGYSVIKINHFSIKIAHRNCVLER